MVNELSRGFCNHISFLRYIFGITYVWSEELITFLFIWVVFFGTVIGVKEDQHIKIDFFYNLLPKKAHKFVEILIAVIVIIVQLFVIKTSPKWIQSAHNVVTAGLRLPFQYIYAILPISAFLIILFELARICQLLLSKLFKISTGTCVNRKETGEG